MTKFLILKNDDVIQPQVLDKQKYSSLEHAVTQHFVAKRYNSKYAVHFVKLSNIPRRACQEGVKTSLDYRQIEAFISARILESI